MRKSLFIPLIIVFMLIVSAVPAWADNYKLTDDGYLAPNQKVEIIGTNMTVDEDGFVHWDLKNDPMMSEEARGNYTVIGRGIIGDKDIKGSETIFIIENCSFQRAFAIQCVYYGPTVVAMSEVYSVNGIPTKTWKEGKKDNLGWGIDYYVPESKLAEFIPTPPIGQKTVGLWLNNRVAALYSMEKSIPWYLDGKPYMHNDVTYIPLRGVFDHLGAKISWDTDRGMAVIEANGQKVEFSPGSDNVQIKDGRVFIPLRLAAERLGYEVAFKNVTHGTWVTVTTTKLS